MDIAALSMSLSQNSLQLSASLRVMAIAKDQAAEQGQNLVQMLSSVQPHLGRNVDIRA
ncbi:YjfB family protein [Paenibacillus arenilitoris]|uniref:YjfB family protein n=1 Tax=Paenibacillus arenilitoris TaxID=2772299 RepID=A0A927CNF5_9BACL|nr:YjfB family protein [Paenibacillus arenilitoris]MBD2870082.1 YjfB family protein [Paenibacillus arenilitoris]